MEHPVRIGAVNYLNTKPLICDLEQLAPDGGVDPRRAEPPGRPAGGRRTRRGADPGRSSISGPAATPSFRTSPSPRAVRC